MPASWLPAWMLLAALAASIVVPLVGGGGRLWWLPVFVWPILIGLFVLDRWKVRGRPPHDRPR